MVCSNLKLEAMYSSSQIWISILSLKSCTQTGTLYIIFFCDQLRLINSWWTFPSHSSIKSHHKDEHNFHSCCKNLYLIQILFPSLSFVMFLLRKTFLGCSTMWAFQVGWSHSYESFEMLGSQDLEEKPASTNIHSWGGRQPERSAWALRLGHHWHDHCHCSA